MNGKLEINGQSLQSELIQTCSIPLMKFRWKDASDFNDCLSEVILTRAKGESGEPGVGTLFLWATAALSRVHHSSRTRTYVLLPATLRHYVEHYRGNGARITVAFNLRHPSFTIPRYEDMKEPNWRWRNFRGPMLAYSRATRLLKRLFS